MDHKIVDGGRGQQRPPKIKDRQNYGEAKYQVGMKKQHLRAQSRRKSVFFLHLKFLPTNIFLRADVAAIYTERLMDQLYSSLVIFFNLNPCSNS